MNNNFRLRRLAVSLAAISLMLAAYYLWARPLWLTVAVGPAESGQWRFAQAAAKALQGSRQPIRLRLVTVGDVQTAGRMLDAGDVDLAIVRSDDHTSKEARSIAVIHRRPVMLVTPADSKIASASDFAGRNIALIIGETDSNRAVMENVLAHYNLKPSDINLSEQSPRALIDSLLNHQLDAAIVVGHPAGFQTRSVLSALQNSQLAFKVSEIGPAEGLALRYREFETSKIPAGIFAGSPPLPQKDVTTIAITYELVAADTLPERQGALLAKVMAGQRTRLRRYEAGTFDVEPPPLDAVRRYLPHAGAAAFANDDVKSLLELYSDEIWMALFGLSLLGSSVTGFLGWVGFRSEPQKAVPKESRVAALARRLKSAQTVHDLETAQNELDALLLEALGNEAPLGEEYDDTDRLFSEIDALSALAVRRRRTLSRGR